MDVFIAIDVASSEFYKDQKYILKSEKLELSADQMIDYYKNLIKSYPILSIEDGLDENDWNGWKKMNAQIGNKCQLLEMIYLLLSVDRLKKGIEEECANSILIKPNQIGTLSETIDAINLAKKNNFNTIISHRSGETEDTFIADLAVGSDSGQIKTGSLSRSERIAKYNQLLRIEDSSESIQFTGVGSLKKFLDSRLK